MNALPEILWADDNLKMKTKPESNTPLNIICLEDSPHDAEINRELLADAGFLVNMKRVANETDFLAALAERTPDIILSDYTLPGFNSSVALQHSLRIHPEVPFICVSGTIGDDTVVEFLKLGATDYVLKDRLDRLSFAVRRALNEARSKQENRRTEWALRMTRFSIEHVSDALYWTTPDGSIVDVNETACRTLGYTRRELLRFTLADIFPHFNPENTELHFSDLRRLGSLKLESEQRTQTGRIFPVEIVSNYVMFDAAERNCAVVRDISERKRNETILHEQLAELRRWESVMIKREETVRELKREINDLLGKACLPVRYENLRE